ncbi:MAG TPA: FtsX-like permease family protein [Candidatus Binatia bacterium]|nr:FtsX-like permease family protein [Candidatus Binatia bacterium]
MKVWLSFQMAYEHVRFGFSRMALAALAIALGVGLVVAIQLMNAAVLNAFLDTLDGTAGRAALTVSAGEGFTFPEEVRETVAAVPGVALAVPLVTGVAFPDDTSGELLTVHGVDLTHDAEVRVYHRAATAGVVDDIVGFLNQTDSIIVGREFAARRGLDVGSPLPLVTPHGVQRFVVRGLLDPEGLARTLGGRLVVMDLYAAERAFATEGHINRIDLLLAPGADLAAVRAAIAGVLPPGLLVEEPVLRKDIVRRSVRGFQVMLTAFGFLAVVAGFVICYSRLRAIFERRAWECGVLRAVGMRRAAVFAELLKESLLLGAAGTLAGWLLGIAIARTALPLVANATAINFHMPVASASPAWDSHAAALGSIVGLLAALLGAMIPALTLSRRSPLALLCLRGREQPSTPLPLLVSAAFVLGLIPILVAWQRRFGSTAAGNLITGSCMVAACLCARPLVSVGARIIHALWGHLFAAVGEFAAGHLEQTPRRISLTVGVLGVGLAAVLLFAVLTRSFERTLVSQLTSRVRSDLVVTSAFVSGGWMNAPLADTLVDDVRAIPGVAVVAGGQYHEIDYRGASVILASYDAPYFNDRRLCDFGIDEAVRASTAASIVGGSGGIISASFAHEFNLGVGDEITLESPRGLQRLRVVGVTRAEPTAAIFIDRAWYRRVWGDRTVTWIHLALSNDAEEGDVASLIMRRFGTRERLQVRDGHTLVNYFAGQAREGFRLVYPMQIIVFCLVLIALSDALASGVLERTREIGVLRAVGLPRRHISQIVVLEGLAIGVLGLTLAAVAGLGLGVFWVEVQFPALLGWQLDLHFPTRFALGAAGLTLAICVVASLVPSVRAARLPVPAALRDE